MMEDLVPIVQPKKYDLFIVKVDENNVVKEYSIYEEKYNMNIECILHLKVECVELLDYANNYKLVDGTLVELIEEEKPIEKPPIDKMEALTARVDGLENINAGLLLENAEHQIKIQGQEKMNKEQEVTNANLLLEIAMLKGAML